jgi:two-component system nitrate/nitrite sensor histidine kinase NarX
VRSFPHWHFEVSDDGRGFDPSRESGETHVGLRIMQERAERIGARVTVESAPGSGCTVALELAGKLCQDAPAAATTIED